MKGEIQDSLERFVLLLNDAPVDNRVEIVEGALNQLESLAVKEPLQVMTEDVLCVTYDLIERKEEAILAIID